MLPLIILTGPTTSRKSETAIALAEKLDAQIIGADSMQVYKYFDIGTAKLPKKERERIPHHLIDLLEPDEEFTAFDFKTRALDIIRNLIRQNKVPLIAGGTGLYLKVLCEDYDCAVQIGPDIKQQVQAEIREKGPPVMHARLQQIDPASAERIQPTDTQRIERALSIHRQTGKTLSEFIETKSPQEFEFPIHTFVIERDRKGLYADIDRRVNTMMEAGWVEEVQAILARGYAKTLKPFQGIGYARIVEFLDGGLTYEKMVELTQRDTRHYAKRQITWFKKVRGATTLRADSSDTPLTLREKILSLLPQAAAGVLALALTFGGPPSAAAGEPSPFQAALTKFQKGDFHQAALLFQALREGAPDSAEGKRALYLLGHSLAKTEQPENAIEPFRSAIETYPDLEDYTRYHLAQAYEQAGFNTEALEQIGVLLEKFPQTLVYARAQLLRAGVLEKEDHIQDAINILSATAEQLAGQAEPSGLSPQWPQLIYQLGHLFQQAGQTREAYARYRDLFIRYPVHPLTGEAEKEINRLAGQPGFTPLPLTMEEHAQRTGELLDDVRYEQAVKEITRLEAGPSPLPGRLYFYLAQALKGLGKRDRANAALKKFLKLYPQHARVQEALFTIGRNLWNTGYYRDGLKYFEKTIEAAPATPWANQARFFIGKMHEEKKRYPRAIQHYTTLVERFGNDEYAERAAWQLGWLHYTTGDFKQASQSFMDSARRYPSGLFIESSLFWTAKSVEKLGRENLAKQLYIDVSRRFPYTYYGIRAREKATGTRDSPIPGTSSQGEEVEEISLTDPSLPPGARFHHIRGVELAATGFYEDARDEIHQVEKSVRKNLSGVMWLAALYNNARAYPDTVRIMQLYKDYKTKVREKELNGEFWKQFYPLAYAQTIQTNARGHGVDPYFVKGLIRQESLFDTQVQSPAGAIGLMQIMPETGRRLYSQSNGNEPFSVDLLFDPETNIQLGIKYISQLNRKFGRNGMHILISYNAGPRMLKKWLKRFSHLDDPDVFIESIPYPETRKYVKKVLRNYGIYRTLYPE